jgi:hypothetical protein
MKAREETEPGGENTHRSGRILTKPKTDDPFSSRDTNKYAKFSSVRTKAPIFQGQLGARTRTATLEMNPTAAALGSGI